MKIAYKKVQSDDYFNADSYRNILERPENISIDAQHLWGNMNVAQMLHHLNLAIGSGIGYYQLKDESNFASRSLAQWIVLDVHKRFQLGAKTPPTLKVTGTFDFYKEKALLKEILQKAYNTKTDSDWSKHTYFGKMSRKNWGKLIMIHCNHHFQQFGNYNKRLKYLRII